MSGGVRGWIGVCIIRLVATDTNRSPVPGGQPGGDPDKRRSTRRLTLIAEAATVLSLVVALIAWWFPHDDDKKPENPARTMPPAPATTGGSTSASSAAPAEAGKSLLGVNPERGAGNLEKADSALVVACASGSSGDRNREIAYPLFRSYGQFTVDLVAAGSAPKETRIQLQVFADQNQVANEIVRVGARSSVRASVSDAETLTLRVTCESPNGIARLENPALR